MDVDAVNSLSTCTKQGSPSPRDGCFKCVGAHFPRDWNARKGNGQAVIWQMQTVKRIYLKNKGKAKGSTGAEGSCKGKPRNTGLLGLENPKSETSSETQESEQTYPTDNSDTDNSWCDDGWSIDE